MKLLEENTGKTFSDINLTNDFSGLSVKATEIKAKINQQNLIKLKVIHTAKETTQTNEKDNLQMGVNRFK